MTVADATRAVDRAAKHTSRTLATVWLFLRFASRLLHLYLRNLISADAVRLLAAEEALALELRDGVARLGGLLVKGCQLASARPDLVPEPYVRVLRCLQDAAPATEFTIIAPWVEGQLGFRLDDHFQSIDPTPIAAASLAQVHRARTHAGEEVVLKIQHPEVRKKIATDLRNLWLLCQVLSRFLPACGLLEFWEELQRAVTEELDFTREASNMLRFAENFADDPDVRFATPLPNLSCATVLTMTYMDGIKISRQSMLTAAGIDPSAVTDLLARSYAKQILWHGFLHLDAHPGNLLVRPGPQLVILDLGLVTEISAKVRAALAQVAQGVLCACQQLVLEGFAAMGVRTTHGKESTLLALADLFLGQFVATHRSFADATAMNRITSELWNIVRADPVIEAPREVFGILNVMGLLSGYGSQVNSSADPEPMLQDLLRNPASSAESRPRLQVLPAASAA